VEEFKIGDRVEWVGTAPEDPSRGPIRGTVITAWLAHAEVEWDLSPAVKKRKSYPLNQAIRKLNVLDHMAEGL